MRIRKTWESGKRFITLDMTILEANLLLNKMYVHAMLDRVLRKELKDEAEVDG